MDHLLAALRACADPTRLRLLALCARGAFCVTELTVILGQSQPRLSRHLRLLTDAGLLDCSREGAHAWFTLSAAPLAPAVLARLPADALLADDARAAARVLAERARAASAAFRRQGADWNEMRALGLVTDRVDAAVYRLLRLDGAGAASLGRVLDLGTGTGQLLERIAPHAEACLGIDASPTMLALARARLARSDLAHCRVRRGDAYRLALPDGCQDVVLAQMLLHHAEDPPAMLKEAARVLRPGGTLLVIDLQDGEGVPAGRFRWPGFANAAMRTMLAEAGLAPRAGIAVSGPITVRLWPAIRPTYPTTLEAAA